MKPQSNNSSRRHSLDTHHTGDVEDSYMTSNLKMKTSPSRFMEFEHFNETGSSEGSLNEDDRNNFLRRLP